MTELWISEYYRRKLRNQTFIRLQFKSFYPDRIERLERFERLELVLSISCWYSRLGLLPNIFPRHVIDDLNFLRRSGAVAHHDHGAVAGVIECVKRSAGDQRGLARLQSDLSAIGETHRALAVQNDEGLIGIMAVHGVFLPRFIVMHPGMEARRVKNILAALFFMRHIDEIDDFNAH